MACGDCLRLPALPFVGCSILFLYRLKNIYLPSVVSHQQTSLTFSRHREFDRVAGNVPGQHGESC